MPPYSMKMSATGLEKRVRGGCRRSVRREVLRLAERVFRPEAFSIIALLNGGRGSGDVVSFARGLRRGWAWVGR